MVTVAIIGILMAAGIVAFSNVQKSARDARRRADVDAIAKAQEQRYQDTGNYASAVDANSYSSSTWNDATRKAELGIYFPSGSLPTDVLNTATYNYRVVSIDQNRTGAANPQTRFCVLARLENGKGNCSGYTGSDWGGNPNSMKCNFVTPGTGQYYCASSRQ